jgi:hypothetical protein
MFALKNADPEEWRDKKEIETPGLNDAIRSVTRRVINAPQG